jgi:hypothetical protein
LQDTCSLANNLQELPFCKLGLEMAILHQTFIQEHLNLSQEQLASALDHINLVFRLFCFNLFVKLVRKSDYTLDRGDELVRYA